MVMRIHDIMIKLYSLVLFHQSMNQIYNKNWILFHDDVVNRKIIWRSEAILLHHAVSTSRLDLNIFLDPVSHSVFKLPKRLFHPEICTE